MFSWVYWFLRCLATFDSRKHGLGMVSMGGIKSYDDARMTLSNNNVFISYEVAASGIECNLSIVLAVSTGAAGQVVLIARRLFCFTQMTAAKPRVVQVVT